jgi:hypothetical protein
LREETVYPSLFGASSGDIFPLTQDLFLNRIQANDIDPRWLRLGVIEFQPTPERASWLYVTSGYSNPWWDDDPEDYDPDGESGAGAEFMFAVSERGAWAVKVLQTVLAYELLLGAGHIANRERLRLHDRIDFPVPIDGQEDCEIRSVVVVEPEDEPQEFSLPSGKVLLVGLTGITDSELAFARRNGSEALIDKLRSAGHLTITDPHRRSIL